MFTHIIVTKHANFLVFCNNSCIDINVIYLGGGRSGITNKNTILYVTVKYS